MDKRTQVRIDKAGIVIGDLFAVLLSYVLAWCLCVATGLLDFESGLLDWFSRAGFAQTRHFLLIVSFLIVGFYIRGHYTRRRPAADEWLDVVKTILLAATLELLLTLMLKWQFSRAWFAFTWLFATLLVPVFRSYVKNRLLRSGHWVENTIIMGIGENAHDTALTLESDPLCGYKIIAFVEPPREWEDRVSNEAPVPAFLLVNGREIPVLSLSKEQPEQIRNLSFRHTVVALDSVDMWQVSKLISEFKLPHTSLNIAPNLRGVPLVGMELHHFFSQELLLLQIRNNLARQMPQRIKRLFDICASATLLVLLAPLLVLLSVFIGAPGGPVFFQQQRVGRFGKIIPVYKFRTMVVDAEARLETILANDSAARAEWDKYCKLTNDPRVTKLGEILRCTSIDELPQLWNVLKGDMSLVGPRPVEAIDLERYGDNAEYYTQIRPGITGIWQISGRSDTSFDARVSMDTWYSRNWTLWIDLFILLKTISTVLSGKGSR